MKRTTGIKKTIKRLKKIERRGKKIEARRRMASWLGLFRGVGYEFRDCRIFGGKKS
jgi:hypothetical protein